MRYWKLYNDKFYSFDEAIKLWKELWEKKEFWPAIKVEENYQEIILDAKNIPSNIDDLEIPLWAIKSNKWQILQPDSEKEQKLEEIENWILYELDFDLDSRFYDASKMSIDDWWNQLNDHFIDEDIAYDIMIWLKNSKRINKK